MGLFYLSEYDRRFLHARSGHSFCADPPKDDEHFALFNKNALTTLQVRKVEQVPNRMEWIVECDEVPPYFVNVLRPVEAGE